MEKKLSDSIELFKRETGIKLEVRNGKPYFGGNFYLWNTPVSSLPDNFTVGGSLYLQDTRITSLPDNLTVGGSLHLQGTPVTSLPDNLTVGGSLHLQGTRITSLPDNLTVGGWLDLRGHIHRLIAGQPYSGWLARLGGYSHCLCRQR